MGDAAYHQQAFASVFVDGTAPPNRGDYARLNIEVAGEPTISGETAEVPVKLSAAATMVPNEDGMPTSNGKVPQEPIQTTWTLKKVGDQWKIAQAPLKPRT